MKENPGILLPPLLLPPHHLLTKSITSAKFVEADPTNLAAINRLFQSSRLAYRPGFWNSTGGGCRPTLAEPTPSTGYPVTTQEYAAGSALLLDLKDDGYRFRSSNGRT